MKDLRIVFMGTPDFAVATLNALIKANYKVVGVITAPDRPAGRGRKLNQSAVKLVALENNLTVLQPTNLKEPTFVSELESLKANLQIVVAFRMLPKVVWQMPVYGTFNLHASLLPDYRGAAPINWALINGETKTGVSTFFIDEKIDTGEIILQKETVIDENETVGELHDKLMDVGSKLVVETVDLIQKGNVKTFKQTLEETKIAPKIFNETCKIDWSKPIDEIFNLIRGLNPYPAAWTMLHNDASEIKVKIYNTKKEIETHTYKIGQIISSKNSMKVAVKEGFMIIETLQLASKKKMEVISLLNGFKFNENSYFH